MAISTQYLRGINDAGGDFGIGTYGYQWKFDSQSTVDYLASRGHRLIRLPFLWENAQPTLNGPLDSTFVTQMQAMLDRIASDGMFCIPDLHNYCRYKIGSTTYVMGAADGTLTYNHMIDFWTKFSAQFMGHPAIFAYGMMNEPHDLPSVPNGFTANATLYDFETGVQSWVGEGATTIAASSSPVYQGTGAVQATKSIAANTTGTVLRMHITAAQSNAQGDTVSAWVYCPAISGLANWKARIQVEDSANVWQNTVDIAIPTNTWTQITYTPTSTIWTGAKGIAIQFAVDNTSAAAINATPSFDYVQQGTVTTGTTAAQFWQNWSQAFVTAMRNAGDNTCISVPGYSYSSTRFWASNHPSPWITDPANNFIYEAHFYPDNDNSGSFAQTYSQENTNAINQGFTDLVDRTNQWITPWINWLSTNSVKGYLGEFDVRSDESSASWNNVLQAIYTKINSVYAHATAWACGEFWPQTYRALIYGSSGGQNTPVNTALGSASVVEANLSNTVVVNLSGSGSLTTVSSLSTNSGSTLYDFESGITPWKGEGTVTVAQSNTYAHGGSNSLAVSKVDLANSPGQIIRVNNASSGPKSSQNGDTVAAWVYVPVGTPGTNWRANIEVMDSAYVWQQGANVTLTPGVWTQITYTPSATTWAGAKGIAVQFAVDNPATTNATLYVDDVTQYGSNSSNAIAGSVAFSGTGSLSVINRKPGFTSTASLSGTGSLGITVGGAGTTVANLSGIGALSIPTTTPSWVNFSSFAGTGVLSFPGSNFGNCNLSGTGTLSTGGTAFQPATPTTPTINPIVKVLNNDGSVYAEMPDFVEVQFQEVLNDVGAWSLKYPIDGLNFSSLPIPSGAPDRYVAVYAGTTEIFRGMLDSDSYDEVNSDDRTGVFTGSSMLNYFNYAVVYPAAGAGSTTATQTFQNATAGTILNTLISQATARGALPFITTNFTMAKDSAGQAWGQTISVTYDIGVTYLEVLKALANYGMIDFRMVGNQLRVYNAKTTMAGNRSVYFRRGTDLMTSPLSETRQSIINSFLLLGDNNVNVEQTDSTSIAQNGRREGFISQGGIGNTGGLQALGQLKLQTTAQRRFSKQPTVLFQNYTPNVDFTVGDYINVDLSGTLESYRVIDWTYIFNTENPIANGQLSLNDYFAERDILIGNAIDALTGASPGANGTTSTVTNPNTGGTTGPDTTVPKPPTALGLSTQVYLDGIITGLPRATVTVSWTNPTQNTDNSAYNDAGGTEVWWRYWDTSIGDSNWKSIQVSPDQNFTIIPNLAVGVVVQVYVRAYDTSGHYSTNTVTVQITTAKDTTPPNTPSTPAVSNYLGVLIVSWDGKDYGGGAMPIDWQRTEVHVSSTNNFTPSNATLYTAFYTPGAVDTVIAGLTPGTTYFIKLIAYDTSGNASTPSAQAVGVPKQIAGTDVAGNTLTYDALAFKDAGNLVGDGSFEQAVTRAKLITAGVTFPADGTAFLGTYYMRITPAGSQTRVVLTTQENNNNSPVDSLLVRACIRGSSGAPGPGYVTAKAYDATGASLSYVVVLNTPTADGTWYQLSGYFTIPQNAVKVEIAVEAGGASGTWDFDALEVRPRVGTAVIEDAAITTAKIASLAVGDAQIANLGAGKITAGILQATVTISGMIQTASSGARVYMSSGGIFAYNSSNVLTYALYASGSTAYYRGDIQATLIRTAGYETAGNGYIELGNTGPSDPVDEIRFFYNNRTGSVRTPSDKPGAVRISTEEGGVNNIYDFGRYGAMVSPIVSSSNPTTCYITLGTSITLNAPSAGGLFFNQSGMATSVLMTANRYINDYHPLIACYSTGGGALKMLYTQAAIQSRSSGDSAYGSIGATNVSSSSVKLKERIVPLNIAAVDSFKSVKLHGWDWIDPEAKAKGKRRQQVGFIMEDLPEWMHMDDENYNISTVVATLVAAVQELDARLAVYENKGPKTNV